MIHFAKMAKVYSSLSLNRKTLMKESFKNGTYNLMGIHFSMGNDILIFQFSYIHV